MKLYTCYGAFKMPEAIHRHPCEEAATALREAGHEPQIVRALGWGALPDAINDRFPGRRHVKAMTGSAWVPALELDDGTAVSGTEAIVAWAAAHPA